MLKTKICRNCKRELPLNDKYFFKRKETKDGFRASCKECMGHEFITIDEIKEQRLLFKKCSKCGEILPATKEYFHVGGCMNGIDSWCKKCKNESHREYIELHGKQIYQQNKEKESIRKHIMYLKNKESIILKTKQYYSTHKHIYKLASCKRRQLKENSICNFTTKEWRECLKFFNYKDAYTGLPMEIVSQDHVIPLSKGGAYIKQNIVPCDKGINSSKSNKDMELWYKNQSFFSEERLEKIYNWIGIKNNMQQLALI